VRSPSLAAATAALLVASIPDVAAAQAWVPPAHTWTLTFVTQAISHDGHLLDHGELDPSGKSTTMGADLVVGYALTDRLSLDAGVPYIAAKYRGPDPPFGHFPVDDCHCFHSGFADFTGTLHYNVIRSAGGVAVTPSVAFVVPSRAYGSMGEAVVGHDLRELQVGVAVGAPVPILSKLVLQGAYSYAIVQRVLGIPNNRSNATIEGDYRLTRRLSLSGIALWQRTHGGLRLVDITSDELFKEHDRLLRDNSLRLGGGASYSWGPWDASATYIGYTRGTNTHLMHALTFTLNWTKHD
jgi:hypothetical protein